MKIADRRNVPEARTRPERLSFKDAESASGQLLALDDAEGIITAIVSVTGTEDEVSDIIVPGAYRETLTKRNPKVCWAHSWEHPIGRTLHIEEIMPGDDRLPSETKDGQPWPREAGALVATMQFNMRTDEGRNAFEAARFYSETGECEYSIGYQVPTGKSARRDGIRYIKALELYEVSVVLFGAHTMTGTLSVKASIAGVLERKRADVHHPRTATQALAAAMEAKAPPAPPFTKQPAAAADAEPEKVKPTVTDRDDLPEHDADTNLTTEDCSCGDTLVFDTSNGWQRLDGSYDHDDGTTHSDYLLPPPDSEAEPAHADEAAPEPPKAETEAEEGEAEVPDPDAPDAVKAPDFSDGVMVALYPDPAAADAVAKAIAGPDETTPREELHVTLAYLGKTSEVSMTTDEMVQRLTAALEGEEGLRGTVGGIGMFPADEESEDGAPTWVPVDVVGLTMLRETIVNALGDDVVSDTHGFTPHMTIGWNLGVIDPLPSIPITFSEVRVVYGDQSRSVPLGTIPDDDEDSWDAKGRLDITNLSVAEIASLTAAFHSLDTMEGKAEGGADRDRGGAEKLRKYWTTGEGGIEIGWGTSGDFTRCTVMLEEHMPGRAEGYCANRHKEMTGMWPGDKDNKSYDPSLETKDTPVVIDSKVYAATEGKGYPRLPGSHQECDDLLSVAVNEALRGDRTDDGWEWDHVSIDGTYDDRLYATRMNFDGTDDRETWEMTYQVVDGGVELGEPSQVELQIIVTTLDGSDIAYDVEPMDTMPFAEDVALLAARFKCAHVARLEGKAGRVLSGSNERQLRAAMETLVAVLAAAGVRISVEEHTIEADDTNPTSLTDSGDVREPEDARIDKASTSPAAQAKTHPGTGEILTVNMADMEAHLVSLEEGLG